MGEERQWRFGVFRVDVEGERLWRKEQIIKLSPKAFAVLRYLIEHAGQLVTKEALWREVWQGMVVTDAALTVCLSAIRRALGDDPKTPHFIETVHRRGYRWVAPFQPPASHQELEARDWELAPHLMESQAPNPGHTQLSQRPRLATQDFGSPTPNTRHPTPVVVGREAELTQLQRWWEKALHGERQLVFVSGETGIGKTTVVEAFLQRIKTQAWIGRGQCIEQYGAGEGYMPVLEAFGRLCREAEGQYIITRLKEHAPTWVAQMPALLSQEEREQFQHEVAGATRVRMLREMAEAIEVLTTERPLVLRIEDLHWSDVSTLEFLSILAHRQEAARLLVLGTYRPVEMLANGHPLRTVRQELHLHHYCEEQRLGFLTEAQIEKYLTLRFSGESQRPASFQLLAHAIHQRTEGNPLFMVTVVESLLAHGMPVEEEEPLSVVLPGTLRQMIEEQLRRLSSEEQRLLEVASVAGSEFSAPAVAAGSAVTIEDVEEMCERLARGERFLRAQGTTEWPDGTIAARYSFQHALYQEVLYERLTPHRRMRLHQRIGEREELGYGQQAQEIAAELALHFTQGRDYRKAIRYLYHAAQTALARSANMEAIDHLTTGLALLKTLPDTPERAQQELELQITLGPALMATRGYAAPEVEHTYARARELCQQEDETARLVPVLLGLWRFDIVRAELRTARQLGEQLLLIAQREQDPAIFLEAHLILGATFIPLGELVLARGHLEKSLALYDPQQHRSHAVRYGLDPKVGGLTRLAEALWFLGYPDQSRRKSQEALALARELAHPFSLAYTLSFAGQLHQCRREPQLVRERAEATIGLATEQGFPFWLAIGTEVRGWALVEQGQGEEGIAQIHRSGRSVFASFVLAEAYGKVGQVEEGLRVVAEALTLVNKIGLRINEAELYRLKGELTLQSKASHGQVEDKSQTSQSTSEIPNAQYPTPNTQAEAEECFLKAIEIAQKQQAKSWELRATMSLVRLRQQQVEQHASRATQHETRAKLDAARTMLVDVYKWFTEGFDTKDLRDAKSLIEELSH